MNINLEKAVIEIDLSPNEAKELRDFIDTFSNTHSETIEEIRFKLGKVILEYEASV